MMHAIPELALRRAVPDQAAALTRLAHASKSHWGYPPEWIRIWSCDLTFSAEFIRDERVYSAFAGEQLVGFYALLPGLARGGDDQEGVSRAELEHLWVDPSAMGYGVGRRLLEHAAETARQSGASWIDINADPYAHGFYLKMGARDIGKVPAPMAEAPDRYLPRMSLDLR